MALLRALIVEDQAWMRLYMQAILRLCGIDAVCAPDGAYALRYASPHAIDLILLDAETRGTNVLDLLDCIAGGAFGRRPPPVIVCSARVDDTLYAFRLRRAGAATLLGKPFCAGHLVGAVRTAFQELDAVG